MATDVMFYVDDHPGELARVGEALGRAGINIDGLCMVTSGGGRAEVHLLVEEPISALNALAEAGTDVISQHEVAVFPIEDQPGALGSVTHRLADAGVNITLAYMATNTRLVLAADDFATARAVLG